MRLRNLTPHAVDLLQLDGSYLHIEPEGVCPRVTAVSPDPVWDPEASAFMTTVRYGEVVDLPEPEEGVLIVTSKITCDACPERSDLVYPTALVRDEQGRIVGADALATAE